MAPLIIGRAEQEALADLRERASREPIDMRETMRLITTPAGFDTHMARMRRLTINLPTTYAVTFSVEIGHPGGTMRHMSMSAAQGRVASRDALWMVATELGFVEALDTCMVYEERLNDGGVAINVIQPITMSSAMGQA